MIRDEDPRWASMKGGYRLPYDPNPDVPEWLASDYWSAWQALLPHALRALKASTDPEALQSAMVVVCLAKGLTALGAVLWYHDQSTLSEYLDERLAWTELYANKAG